MLKRIRKERTMSDVCWNEGWLHTFVNLLKLLIIIGQVFSGILNSDLATVRQGYLFIFAVDNVRVDNLID